MSDDCNEAFFPSDNRLEIFKECVLLRAGIEQVLTPVASRQGLTPIGVFILYLVSRRESFNITRMCREMNLNQGNASNMCKKLECGGYITRTRSDEDERIVRITITPLGKKALEAVSDEIGRLVERAHNKYADFAEDAEESFKKADTLIRHLSEQSC